MPDGSVILHIGPHKTGTTALQGSLWAARDELPKQGVRLVGRSRNPAAAVRAVTGQVSPYADDGRVPPMARWSRLAGEIRRARDSRVIVSSEFFAWADPTAIRRIVDELGADRVHIAVTLRPLRKIVPSMWQQNVQAGTVATIDAWLQDVLDRQAGDARHPFWTLHRHEELIGRWAAAVGVDRVTGVVVDDRDHDVLLHAFEDLLGLTRGTLAPQADWQNRSLTLPEAEAVRAFNLAFKGKDLPRGRHARLMRFGAAQVMKQRAPSKDEARVALPAWAEPPIDGVQRDMVEGIARSGVRIVGDLGRLTEPPREGAGAPTGTIAANILPSDAATSDVLVRPDAAAAMAMGVLVAAGEARPGRSRFETAEPVQVLEVPTYQLVAVVFLRAWRWAARLPDRAMNRFRRATGQPSSVAEP
jgi:hypothetical protein